MRQRPTAIFTATDNLAIGVLAWCRDNGVAVPGDVAVVGYDNVEAAEFAEVPLTTSITLPTRSAISPSTGCSR